MSYFLVHGKVWARRLILARSKGITRPCHCGKLQTWFPREIECEMLVAKWLRGRIMGENYRGFDVAYCEAFPHLRIQVKYSDRNSSRRWLWNKHTDTVSDVIVLFGEGSNGHLSVFLMTESEYMAKAHGESGVGGGYMLGASARSVLSSGHRNWLFNYVVVDPDRNLEAEIIRRGLPADLSSRLPLDNQPPLFPLT